MTLITNEINITGKKVEAETYLPYTSFNGTEIVRIKKLVNGEWKNFYTKFSDLLAWILVNGGQVEKIKITASEFSAGVYTNNKLVGLNELKDFVVFTNGGSGTLVDFTDGVNIFSAAAGTLTMHADEYVLLILVP